MRSSIAALAAAAVLATLPAHADDRHRSGVHVRPSISVGFGHPFGWYRPWAPWGYWPSYYGIGVQVGRAHPVRTTSRERGVQSAMKLYVYPAAGQSRQQLADDRYDCHVWAADQSGHDPTLGAGSRRDAVEYTRAFTACMEARSYVVK